METLASFLHAAVALATPIALAALGETLAECAGVLFLGLEGTMLAGAFGGALAATLTGSPWAGLAAGVASGVLLASVFALVTLRFRADEVIAGMAVNLLAAGGTAVAWRAAFGLGAQRRVPGFEEWSVPGLAEIPLAGRALFEHHLFTYAAIALAAASWVFLRRSGTGLRLRACGEAPEAAAALGIPVARARAAAILGGGALAGLGGAALSLAEANAFVEGMTAGRGFVAIALVIFGAHHPLGAAGAALLFGAALALQYRFQAAGWSVPPELFRALPYLLSLAVLAGFAGRRRPPAALGRGLP